MKPRVFLSHSKTDRAFVERLAGDLRAARIDVWYDEWEIPSGVSFRKRIFEEGITESDLFFVYLTPTSASSHWVARELDAAFVLDAEARGGTIAMFVDAEATRQQLTVDLRSLHCPVLNDRDYPRSFAHLIGRAWEAASARRIKRAKEDSRSEILSLEKSVAELRTEIARLENVPSVGVDATILRLQAIQFPVGGDAGATYSLYEIFNSLAPILSIGAWQPLITNHLKKFMVPGIDLGASTSLFQATGYQSYDILGPLIISRLVRVSPPVGEYDDQYYLTELGALVAERSMFADGH